MFLTYWRRVIQIRHSQINLRYNAQVIKHSHSVPSLETISVPGFIQF